MKKTALLLVAALCLSSRPVRAQSADLAPSPIVANVNTPASSVQQPSLPTISGTAAAPAPATLSADSWYKLGSAWGPNKAWQAGVDTSPTVGACAFIGAAKGQGPKYIVGPCRDVLLVAKAGRPIYHLGFLALGYDVSDLSHSHPYYLARGGVNIGPAASAFLNGVADRLPYLESALDWQAPAPLQYLGKISTLDAGGGPGIHTKPVYGAGVKLDVPTDDIVAVIKAATGH